MNNKIKCRLCNERFKVITHTHLKKVHGINSIEEYKTMFPEASTISNEVLDSLRTNTLEYWIFKHGEIDGPIKYKAYTEFLGEKNTFEYKKKEYGWTQDQFDEFNASRAVTLENLVNRHGEEKGTTIFNNYREKQRTAGISLEYFQNKYGIVEGKAFYLELNKKKSHTLENYIRLYGDEATAKTELEKFFANLASPNSISNLQRKLITLICKHLPLEYTDRVYSCVTRNNKEFVQWSPIAEQAFSYDFVLLYYSKKLVIEVNGDYWHCNPIKYDSNFYHSILKKTAKKIWEYDEIKRQHMVNNGFDYLTVWEYDCKDMIKKVEEIVEWILKKRP